LPDDPRQPFWNETGAPMKPLAKLTVNRQRLYQKSCVNEDLSVPFSEAENDMYIDAKETTPDSGNSSQKHSKYLSFFIFPSTIKKKLLRFLC